MRQPLGSTRAKTSTRSPAVRPIMSAPGPRAGSSGRWGSVSNEPVTVFAASRASVPGIEPTPVAVPAPHDMDLLFSLTQEGYETCVYKRQPEYPGRTDRSWTSASRGRSSARSTVVATESGSIHFSPSYSAPSCCRTFTCMGVATRPG